MKFRTIIDKSKDEEVVVTVHHPTPLTGEIEALVLKYAGADRLPAFTEDELTMLPIGDIECITVLDGKTIAIHSSGKQYRIKQRLYELENMLPSTFIRINKSTLANETRLARFAAAYSGAVDAVFQSGYTDYVSRRCFAEIKRRYYK